MSDRRSPIEVVTVAQLIEMFSSTLGVDKSGEEISAALSRLGIYGVTLSPDQTTTLLDAMSKSPGMVGITARVARSRLELGRAPHAPYPEMPRPESFHGVPPSGLLPREPMSTPRMPRPSSHSGVRNATSGSHASPPSTSRPVPPSSPRAPAPSEPFSASAVGGPAPFAFSSDEPPTSSRPDPSGRTVTPVEIASLLANALSPEGCLEAVRGAIRTLGLPTEHLDKGQAVAVLDQLAKEPGPLGLCARFGKARLILRFAA
jgi:hypothetical protein